MKSTLCPHCGSDKVVVNITVRWNQSRSMFQPQRGNFCTTCGKAFDGGTTSELGFRTVRVDRMTPELAKLQSNGDLIVVRHRNGVTEVLY